MKDKIILNKIMNTQTEISFAWHVHHNILLEPLTEPITNRIAYIKKEKPIEEQPLRLRLLKEIKGKLPLTVVKAWEAHVKAREAYDKAWEAYVKAWEAHVKAREAHDKAWEAYDKAWEAYVKALEAHVKANEAYVKAWEAYVKALEECKKEIKELHKKECPNCPWDGKTIFSKGWEKLK
jgi:hypothetical protein